MLQRYRRYFAIAAFLLLATPLAVGIVQPDDRASILKEGRNLAPPPKTPETAAEWLAFSKEIDSYLQDHFGLRHVLIRTHKDLTKPLLGLGNNSVLIGRDGRMFYLGEDTVRQSAGLVLRDRRVSDTADLLAKISHALAAREIRFLVAIPPNAPSIFQDDLPHWAQDLGRPTEYDLILADLAERGVRTVDLRPSLKKTKSDGSVYYMYDTHWTPRGGLAAFDAIVEADGHPDWLIDPTSALGPPQPHNGDLARMLGVEGLTEAVENLTLPPGQADPNFPGESVRTSGQRGPTVMIFGDSFTGAYFPPMLLQHAGRVIWLEHDRCGFDWKAIDRFRPDEVWWMPNEQFLICNPGVSPVDFTG